MMPGENHSKTAGLASDATAGACQNCTVLQESINEYVAALLSLKQKIIDTDHLLTEYQEKCDELQRSQTETSKLHQQLDELLEKMVPLEKQNKDYESLRSELEEKKSTLEKYEKAAVELDALREENSKAKALNMKLENQLQQLEETVLKQRNENGQLKREKEVLEEELEKAKSFQKTNHQAVCEIEHFKEENAKIQAQKKSLENQFELLKESSIRHILEIEQLKLDKQALEGKLHKTQRTLEKLQKENQKETRNSATQTNVPKEPKIDKVKVRLLLEELWKCVEPQTANGSLFSDDGGHSSFGLPVVANSPLKQQNSQALPNRTSSASLYCESLKAPRTPLASPGPQETAVVPKAAEASRRALRKRKRSRNSDEHLNTSGLKGDIMELDTHEKQDMYHAEPTSCGIQESSETSGASIEEIFALLKPLPPPLSPLSFPCPPTKEAVFGIISDSSDEDDEVKTECIDGKKMAASLKKPSGELCLPHQEDLPSTKPEFKCSAEFNGQSIQQTADIVAESKLTVSVGVPLQMSHCAPLESVCERRNVPLTVKLKDNPLKSPIERPVVTAMSNGSCSSTTVRESLSCGVELDLPEPVKFEILLPNREDVAERISQHDNKMDAEDAPIEDSLDITPNGHQEIQSTPANVSKMELQQASLTKGILYENRNKSEVCEDVEMEVRSPADRSNVTVSSLSNGFIHSECNETEVRKPSDILNNLMKENSIGALKKPSEKCKTKATGLNGCEIFSSEHVEEKAGVVKDLQHDSSMQNAAEGNILSNTVVHFSDEIGGVKEEASDTADDDDLTLNAQVPIITIPKSELSDSVTSHDESVSENYRDENDAVVEESKKPNEQQTNVVSSAGEAESSREILLSVGEEIESMHYDVKDATSSMDPVMEDKISNCLDNLATQKESSDEQESFELQRKVRRNCQRTSNQASSGSIDALSTSQDAAQKCVAPEIVQDLASMHSLNEDSDRSSSSERTQANLGVQLSPNSKLSETEKSRKVLGDSLEPTVQESVPGLSFENMRNGSESSSEEISLDHQNILEQKKAALRSPLMSPNLESFSVPVSIITIDANEKTDKSQSENEMSSDDCAKVNKQVVSENGTVLPADPAPAETCRASPQEHSCQPSDNVSESLEVSRSEEHSQTSPSLSDGADISPSTKSPGAIKKVRSEMGPPLPPLLLPLTVTPKKPQILGSPSRMVPGKLSFLSPSSETVLAEEKSPLADRSDGKSQSSRSLSPSESKHERIISSPLQFCSATPKHAVPVPGRFPASALGSSPNGTQENSVRILDTMYPELSARARTLNILRGNVNLSRSAPENSVTAQAPVSQITGFKCINSSSTAFTKTGKSFESENGITKDSVEPSKISEIDSSKEVTKKTGVNVLLPSSAKRLRLDSCSPVPSNAALRITLSASAEMDPTQSHFPQDSLQTQNTQSGIKQQVNSIATKTSEIILNALTKVLSSCFDLLPVIKSHVSIGRISKLPVLRDEEKEVIAEFCTENKSLTDDFLCAILTKLKMEKNSLSGEQLQALCRVYTGLCRQRGDWERPHLLAYSILKEDFPNSAKLILFMVTTWYNILPQRGVVFNAMHAVIRQKADEEVLQYLTAYLGWETNSPCDIQKMIAKTLVALKMGTNMKFQHHDRHGDDLSPNAWEYIFAIDLLCTEKKWAWTYDNIISKELWPIMNKWVSEAKHKHGSVHDITVATVLRLIGRLGQLGLKEKSAASVKNVAKIINMFGRKGNAEGVPWAVQLAAVYTIYDLSPSDPKDALEALAAWRADTTQPVPPAVTSCITQIGSVCRLVNT